MPEGHAKAKLNLERNTWQDLLCSSTMLSQNMNNKPILSPQINKFTLYQIHSHCTSKQKNPSFWFPVWKAASFSDPLLCASSNHHKKKQTKKSIRCRRCHGRQRWATLCCYGDRHSLLLYSIAGSFRMECAWWPTSSSWHCGRKSQSSSPPLS